MALNRDRLQALAVPLGLVVLAALLRLAEQLIRTEPVFHASRRVGAGAGDQAKVLGRVGILAQLAPTAGELGRRSQRWHPITPDQARNGGVIHA